ncbi:MAG: hypothetical protein A4E65_02863 [Syntrophorhabdus sp. PtaU1.Bin153]|nr:MAG: hypothetical protein A4E65_02863 [Syntrophorhabdus sp. PtaU1.Bin153]
MSSLAVSLVAFSCILGGMLFGMFLRMVLPEHHLSDESKDAVKLGIGMIATLAALVLGLLIASAKGTFDTMNNGLIQTGSKIILLDRVMAHYGPETREVRDLLRRSVASVVGRFWSKKVLQHTQGKALNPRTGLEAIQDKLLQLSPQSEEQRWLLSQALEISSSIAQVRWLLTEQREQSSLPMPFFVMLVFWLVIIFFSFGMISPPNATVITVLLVCSLSVAGALYMILELDHPYEGLIEISSAPLSNALAYIGK